MNLATILYAIGLYLALLCFGFYLNTAHGQARDEIHSNWPHASTGYSGRIPPPSKTCREYLSLCERSCSDRGDLYRFQCLGKGFQPDAQRYRCQCGDDAFQVNSEPISEKVQ